MQRHCLMKEEDRDGRKALGCFKKNGKKTPGCFKKNGISMPGPSAGC